MEVAELKMLRFSLGVTYCDCAYSVLALFHLHYLALNYDNIMQ